MPYDLQKLMASGFRELLEDLLGSDFDAEVLQHVLPWPSAVLPLNRGGRRLDGRRTRMSRHLRLHEVMAEHADCAASLAELPFRRGFMGFLKLAAAGRELEALEELAGQFDCTQPVSREDERGRALPAHWPVVLDIRPAYHTDDGATFFPAWLITVAWQESGGQTGMPWLAVIDARKP